MSPEALHRRARTRRVHPAAYWPARALVQAVLVGVLGLRREGRHHLPRSGGLILAANHRSLLDPLAIALLARRPLYYVAKGELFAHPLAARVLSALGAFPVARGTGDDAMLATARAILARGDAVLIFPEGTRVREPGLRAPRRGVGRLALETGVPVVPVAIAGTGARRGRRARPGRVRVRAGAPLHLGRVARPTPEQAAEATRRIWPEVALRWEWLGGAPSPEAVRAVPLPERGPAPAPRPAAPPGPVVVLAGPPEEESVPAPPTRTGRFRRA